MSMTVLITEDHELYRDGLRLLVEEAIPGVRLLEASDFPETLSALAANNDIAILFLDIQIPGTKGLDGLKEIKARYPVLPVIVVSTVDHDASIQQMLRLGADCFIAKSSPRAVMIDALQSVVNGERVVISARRDESITLTPRQLETLELLALGLPNKEIASQMTISPATVREYVSDLLIAFDCDNRTQLVLKAHQLGFILE
ncbi:response regulator transcription factor [Reinekea blandensis]|uniref:Response regulator n=1 Tax=Reinekea blandensis MED297 TaxID=314283 RepID=A4BBV1_9GAMM|nr:response regulator transcription factor [Reinekea blandensis]EAR10436.1 Response regulator [Reinekea sp. MED297] [Reinekea blandensis MED297]